MAARLPVGAAQSPASPAEPAPLVGSATDHGDVRAAAQHAGTRRPRSSRRPARSGRPPTTASPISASTNSTTVPVDRVRRPADRGARRLVGVVELVGGVVAVRGSRSAAPCPPPDVRPALGRSDRDRSYIARKRRPACGRPLRRRSPRSRSSSVRTAGTTCAMSSFLPVAAPTLPQPTPGRLRARRRRTERRSDIVPRLVGQRDHGEGLRRCSVSPERSSGTIVAEHPVLHRPPREPSARSSRITAATVSTSARRCRGQLGQVSASTVVASLCDGPVAVPASATT